MTSASRRVAALIGPEVINLATRSSHLLSVKEEVNPGKVEVTNLMLLKNLHPSLCAENAEIDEKEVKDGSIKKIASWSCMRAKLSVWLCLKLGSINA